jgi:superfamily II DNA/RNA helicase
MLDMGFYDDIMKIVNEMPKERQTILFSATMPDKINEMAKNIMHNPVEVKLAVSKPAENIAQGVYHCYDKDKTAIVQHIFKQTPPERVIIFASSKQKVKELNIELKRKGYNAAAMHSDLEQKQRDEVMLAFRAMKIDVLVATDIVARGIDIDDIAMVINYDVPRDPEDYVHRIGRTARAGRSGKAFTLVNAKDRFALRNIEKLLEKKVPVQDLPEGMEAPKEEPESPKKKGKRKYNNRRGKSKSSNEGVENKPRKKRFARNNKSKSNKSKENKPAENNK